LAQYNGAGLCELSLKKRRVGNNIRYGDDSHAGDDDSHDTHCKMRSLYAGKTRGGVPSRLFEPSRLLVLQSAQWQSGQRLRPLKSRSLQQLKLQPQSRIY
jgi:hypothetical protein